MLIFYLIDQPFTGIDKYLAHPVQLSNPLLEAGHPGGIGIGKKRQAFSPGVQLVVVAGIRAQEPTHASQLSDGQKLQPIQWEPCLH